MSKLIRGRVWKYGDNVNTDVIFPGKYTYTVTERAEIARHALEDLDPAFANQVQPGDIIVAGRNWGCGSSREQAASCLAYNGVGALIAASALLLGVTRRKGAVVVLRLGLPVAAILLLDAPVMALITVIAFDRNMPHMTPIH